MYNDFEATTSKILSDDFGRKSKFLVWTILMWNNLILLIDWLF